MPYKTQKKNSLRIEYNNIKKEQNNREKRIKIFHCDNSDLGTVKSLTLLLIHLHNFSFFYMRFSCVLDQTMM